MQLQCPLPSVLAGASAQKMKHDDGREKSKSKSHTLSFDACSGMVGQKSASRRELTRWLMKRENII